MKKASASAPARPMVTDSLPLRPVVYAILVTLAEAPSHGYAVMKQVNERIGARALLGPGTLYRTLKELRDLGWIEPASLPAEDPGDERRRYYQLTTEGREVAAAETRRLERLVGVAQRSGLPAEGRAEA